MSSTQKFFLPFLKRKKVARNTYSFFFDRTKSNFDFLPGQYIRMTLPHPSPDERGISRYFTIASSPLDKKYVMVTTKMIQSTFKETLHGLKKGDPVQFFGPMGWFLQPEDEQFEKVFIAGGIGITPFHSLLLAASKKQPKHPMTLFASFSTKEDAIFYDELLTLSEKYPHIRVVYVFSKAQENQHKPIDEKGRISKTLLKKYIKDLKNPKYYVVGPFEMVENTKALLLSLTLDEEKIFTEDFTGY